VSKREVRIAFVSEPLGVLVPPDIFLATTIPLCFEIARNQGTVQSSGYYTLLVNLSIR